MKRLVFSDRLQAALLMTRSRWMEALISFLLVTALLFGLLSNSSIESWFGRTIHRSSQVATVSQAANAPSRSSAGGLPLFPATAADEPTQMSAREEYMRRRASLKRIDSYGDRRDMLEETRQRLLRASATIAYEEAPQPKLSAEQKQADVRKQLTSALIRLLMLERDHSSGSSEIISIRKQITMLQARLALSTVSPKPVAKTPVRAHIVDHKDELDHINTQIAQCDQEIADGLQELSRVATLSVHPGTADGSKQAAVAVADAGSVSSQSVSQKADAALLVTSSGERTRIPSILVRSIISVAFGLLLGLCVLLFAHGSDSLIRDEAKLKRILPSAVEYVGNIPRMKAS